MAPSADGGIDGGSHSSIATKRSLNVKPKDSVQPKFAVYHTCRLRKDRGYDLDKAMPPLTLFYVRRVADNPTVRWVSDMS